MKLVKDSESFIEQQEIFTGEMIARISEHLENSGVQGDLLKELTGKISFEVASMIDGVSKIEFENSSSFPYLTFQKGDDEIIDFSGNSFTHELVYGIINAMFSGSA